MASLVFDIASDGIAKNTIDWENDDIRVLLLTGNGTPVKTNATVAAALAESNVSEATATSYARETIDNASISTSGGKTLFDGDEPEWASLGGDTNNTITGALIYKHVDADDADNIPICYQDTNDLTTNGGQVVLRKDATNKWFFLDNT